MTLCQALPVCFAPPPPLLLAGFLSSGDESRRARFWGCAITPKPSCQGLSLGTLSSLILTCSVLGVFRGITREGPSTQGRLTEHLEGAEVEPNTPA